LSIKARRVGAAAGGWFLISSKVSQSWMTRCTRIEVGTYYWTGGLGSKLLERSTTKDGVKLPRNSEVKEKETKSDLMSRNYVWGEVLQFNS